MVATALLMVVAAYLAIGLVWAVFFVTRGVATVDHAAQGAPWRFRILILPGSAALWPALLARWLRESREGKTG